MGNISDSVELKEAIQLLEAEKSAHFQAMRANFCLAFESLRPAKFIVSTMKEIGSSPYLIKNILNIGFGLVTGYLSKKVLLIGRKNNKSGKLLGLILQLGITNLVVYTPVAMKFLRNMIGKNKKDIETINP